MVLLSHGRVMYFKKKMCMRLVMAMYALFISICASATESYNLEQDSIPSIPDFLNGVTKSDSGFVNIYQKEEQVFLQIPDSILGRDILTTITILKGAQNNARSMDKKYGYGGDSMFEKLVQFRKDENRINLIKPEIQYTESDSSIYSEYYQSYIHPVLQSFPIVAGDEHSYVIDITNYYLADSELFALAGVKTELELGSYLPQDSYSTEIVSYPTNANFRSIRTYMAGNAQNATYPKMVWEIGSSWFLLPKELMKPRLFSPKVGYFSTIIRGQFGSNYSNELIALANRWRLEPRAEDMEKYMNGELVEPTKPIVFYVDKNMPSYLVQGVIEAVNAWQKAFEEVGFKNAIYALPEPTKEQDPEFSEDDARYSIISYKASPVPNAYGPQIVDPRSGEIICSHVAIFHSVMDLVQMWYFAMCSPSDPEARTYPVKPEVMSKLIHTVVMHEVGHTLGLRHNFMGSTIYPTDSLRSNAFIEANGLGASIMDYQRFNYVAQPEDHIAQANLFPRIGVYDTFAIKWGYQFFSNDSTPSAIEKMQNIWLNTELNKEGRGYVEESNHNDPRVQSEDCSSDIIYASELAMKNLKYIMQHIESWTNQQSDEDYVLLRRRYLYVLSQYQSHIDHVLEFMGGYYTEDSICSHGSHVEVYKATSYEDQKRALDFLGKYYFADQDWLFSPLFIQKLDYNVAERIYNPMFTEFGKIVVSNMLYSTSESIDASTMSYKEMLNTIFGYLFLKHDSDEEISEYMRVEQSNFLSQLTINVENNETIPYNVNQLFRTQIYRIRDFALKHSNSKNRLTQNHYKGIVNFITMWEQGNQNL